MRLKYFEIKLVKAYTASRYNFQFLVGGIGFEPMTSSASGKHSSTELTTHIEKIISVHFILST